MAKEPGTSPLSFPIRLFIFWLILFQVARLLFLIFLYNQSAELSSEWPKIFIHGLRLDFSTACYASALPLLLYVIHLFIPSVKRIVQTVLSIELFLLLLLLISNIQVYKAWGTLINRRAVTFLADPAAIFASLSGWQLFLICVSFLFLYFLCNKVLQRLVMSSLQQREVRLMNFIIRFAWLLILPIGIRGGLQQIPVNESAATFSQDAQLNSAAMNPAWYFVNNLLKSGLHQKNIYRKYSNEQAIQILRELKTEVDSTQSILTINKPNIVFIALESWTADLIQPLGGDVASTPFFNALCQEGLLFTSIYSSGRRTDQMFPSVLSGFPAQPNHSIIRFPSKTERLPMLSRDLKAAGFATSFYYGGELGFANMRSYLLQGKFDKIVSRDDFTDLSNLNKWGAHDEYLLKLHADEIEKMKQPFFSFLLTLSTHEPFDVPGPVLVKGDREPDKFRNSAAYTDRCLRDYFNELKKSRTYENTLFVLFADHGHLLPLERAYNDPNAYRIPLLICGGALRPEFHGKQILNTGSQHDLPSTLLRQLHLSSDAYVRSNNLLNVNRYDYAYLNMDDGAGWIEKEGALVWTGKDTSTVPAFTHPPAKQDDKRLNHLLAYLQVLFEDFLKN